MFVAASSSLLVNYYYMGIPMHWCCARILLFYNRTQQTHSRRRRRRINEGKSIFPRYTKRILLLRTPPPPHTRKHVVFSTCFGLSLCVCAFAFILFLSFALMMAFCYVVVFFYILTIYFNVQASNLHVSVCVWERNYMFWQTEDVCLCDQATTFTTYHKIILLTYILTVKGDPFFRLGVFFFLMCRCAFTNIYYVFLFVTKLWITT